MNHIYCFFFFQAEDGIRDVAVTGVQTCALPIYRPSRTRDRRRGLRFITDVFSLRAARFGVRAALPPLSVARQEKLRSEERRVGKEGRYLSVPQDGQETRHHCTTNSVTTMSTLAS